MEASPKSDKELKDLTENINSILDGINYKKFSEPAYENLKIKIQSYISDLVKECIIVIQRDKLDSVSARHVDIAEERLKQINPKSVFKHFGTVGGILAGTCLSNLYSILDTGKYTQFGIVFTFIIRICGTGLLVINFMKE